MMLTHIFLVLSHPFKQFALLVDLELLLTSLQWAGQSNTTMERPGQGAVGELLDQRCRHPFAVAAGYDQV